jgi:hypothetical protein
MGLLRDLPQGRTDDSVSDLDPPTLDTNAMM